MLCLNRKKGQGIQINEDVTITVLEIKAQSVRLGIEYGEKSRVLRQEVYLRIQQDNREAMESLKKAHDKLEDLKDKARKKMVV